MSGDVVAYGHGVELSGGELPYGAVTDGLRSLVRDLGGDVVRDAAGTATSTLAALCPALGERGESIDQVQLYGGFVSTVETLATDRLLWLVFEDLHFTDATSRDLIGYLVRVANPCRLVIVMTTRLEELSEQPSLSRFVTDLSRVDRVTEITLAPWTRIEVEQHVTQLSPAQPTAGLLDRVAALAQGNPFLVEQLLTAGVDSTGPVPDSVLSLMQDRVARLGDETRRLVQMASLADGHVTHRLLQDVYAPKSSASGDVLALPIADAVGHHVLQFDPDSLTYSFVHALLREAVEASVPPADRLDWHRRWAEVISRQAQSDRDLSLQVAAAHHWAQAGADIEAFDAAIAAGQASYRIGANAEVGRLFARALRLWDRVPDPSGRAGVSRDQVLMDAVMSVAETIDPSGALALIDAELARERIAKGDRTRTLCLRLARAILDGPLRQPQDARVDAEGLQAMEALISMDPSPLQIVALIRLGSSVWHTDPDRAHRIYQEAFLAAQELGDLRRQRWAGSTMATHLGCQGRMEAALATCEMLIRDATDSTVSLMDMEAERGFSLNHAGRYREARAAIEHALSCVSDPLLCQHLWARAETSLCAVLFALGEWDKERSHLERLQELPPLPGDERVILARTAVQWACHRGDERAAQHWVDLAQANLPTDDGAIYLDTWVDVSWLTAETALARGDLISAREALMPLWDVPGYEMYWEAWHPVLLAARIEADLADQARTGVGPPSAKDGKDTIAAIRAVGAKLPLYGDLGAAREAQLAAELARASGLDEPAHWAPVVEAWSKVGHVPNLAWALLRLGAAHINAGNRDEAVEPLSESLRIAGVLGWPLVRDCVADLARRSRLRLDAPTEEQPCRGQDRLGRLTARELDVLQLIAQGMSNEEIGATLFISPRTASVHTSRILTKLNVTTRAKATAVAYEEGLFTERAGSGAYGAS